METIHIAPYANMSDMDDETLGKLVDHEREVYGYEGFGEYLFCTNPDCRRIQSIDEVYGVADTKEAFVPLKELEKNGAHKPDCPDCHSPTLLIFDPEYFKPYLASLFRGAYGALLMDGEGDVQGSTFTFTGKLQSVFNKDINYKDCFKWDEFREKFSEIVGHEALETTPVVCSNRVSIGHHFRGGATFAKLLGSSLNMHPEYDRLPGVAATRLDSALYPLSQILEYKNIVEDPSGLVAIGIDQIGKTRAILNLSPEEFKQKFSAMKQKIKEWQKGIKRDKSHYRYYKGASLLDQFQKTHEKDDRQSACEPPEHSGQNYQVENYSFAGISPGLIRELADTFRFQFCNCSEYGQYLFYPSEGKPITAEEVFNSKAYVDLDRMDGLDLNAYPKHPVTGEKAIFWHDPEICRKNLASKLSHGQVSIIKDRKAEKIGCMFFGYEAMVQQAFEYEEWENPFNYSGYRDQTKLRSLDHFLRKINEGLNNNPRFQGLTPLRPSSGVYILNCISTLPDYQGRGWSYEVGRGIAEMLAEKYTEDKVTLFEIKADSRAFNLFRPANGVVINDAWYEGSDSNGGSVLMAFRLKDIIKMFTSAPKKDINVNPLA